MGPYSLQSAVSNISHSKDISSASFSLTTGTVIQLTSDTSVSMASNMDFYSVITGQLPLRNPLGYQVALHHTPDFATVTTPSSFNLHYHHTTSSSFPSLPPPSGND